MKTISDFVTEIKPILVSYGIDQDLLVDAVLELEIKSAIGVINRCRRFTPVDDILYDEKYEDKILPLAITGYLKAGAEGETVHSENGITRQYGNGNKYPKEMLQDIIPLAKII